MITGQESSKDTQVDPEILKEEEFILMCEFIELGLWRTTNLSKACNVDRKTVDIWKTHSKAQIAYRKAVKNILKKRGVKGDVEKMMKEVSMEVDGDELTVKLIEVKGLENL